MFLELLYSWTPIAQAGSREDQEYEGGRDLTGRNPATYSLLTTSSGNPGLFPLTLILVAFRFAWYEMSQRHNHPAVQILPLLPQVPVSQHKLQALNAKLNTKLQLWKHNISQCSRRWPTRFHLCDGSPGPFEINFWRS